jgi:proteic killer suppression protein
MAGTAAHPSPRPPMIVSFKDAGTRDIYEGNDTRDARNTCPSQLWRVAQKRMEVLNNATGLQHLKEPPGNRPEKLLGDRRGQYSIRINLRYRICFSWTEEGPAGVEIVDYHP